MINRLTRARIDVENGAIARFVDAKLHSQGFSNLKHVREEGVIFFLHVVKCRDVLCRTYKNMHRRLGPCVFECHYELILVHEL